MARMQALVNQASITIPNAWAGPGERAVFERRVRAGPVNGILLTAPRATTANKNKRDDSAATVFSVKIEGQREDDGTWMMLGSVTGVGGIYKIQSDPERRALLGKADEELDDDLLAATFPATAFSNVRVTLDVQGDRFLGTMTLDLLGP